MGPLRWPASITVGFGVRGASPQCTPIAPCSQLNGSHDGHSVPAHGQGAGPGAEAHPLAVWHADDARRDGRRAARSANKAAQPQAGFRTLKLRATLLPLGRHDCDRGRQLGVCVPSLGRQRGGAHGAGAYRGLQVGSSVHWEWKRLPKREACPPHAWHCCAPPTKLWSNTQAGACGCIQMRGLADLTGNGSLLGLQWRGVPFVHFHGRVVHVTHGIGWRHKLAFWIHGAARHGMALSSDPLSCTLCQYKPAKGE
jgi:hypothetical protein